MSSAPVFPYPGGVAGDEPPDPTAGAPGHFAWSRWIKQFVKNLDAQKVAKSGDTMTGPLNVVATGSGSVNGAGITIASGPDNKAIARFIKSDWGANVAMGDFDTRVDEPVFRFSDDGGSLAALVAADPVHATEVATKGYVDRAILYGLSTVTTDANGTVTITDCPSTHWIVSAQQGNAVAGSGMWSARITGYTNTIQVFDFTGTAPVPRVNAQIAVAWLAVKK